MKPIRFTYTKSKVVPNEPNKIAHLKRAIILELEESKANNIQVLGNVISFKNNPFEFRMSWDLMGVLSDGFFELVEDKDTITINVEVHHSLIIHLLFFPLLATAAYIASGDPGNFFLLLGTLIAVIASCTIVEDKIGIIFNKF